MGVTVPLGNGLVVPQKHKPAWNTRLGRPVPGHSPGQRKLDAATGVGSRASGEGGGARANWTRAWNGTLPVPGDPRDGSSGAGVRQEACRSVPGGVTPGLAPCRAQPRSQNAGPGWAGAVVSWGPGRASGCTGAC